MSAVDSTRPLLTFALVCFNQEQFIEKAVAAALAQTYQPLQVILSDDCSSDKTFMKIEEVAQAYRGPHAIVLNRNRQRLGLADHFNRIFELAKGQYIVGAAGDDISCPERTDLVYEAWRQSGWKAHSIYSRFSTINAHGQPLSGTCFPPSIDGSVVIKNFDPYLYIKQKTPTISGCTHAFSPKIYSIFGALPSNVINEDLTLGFRSVLLGPIGCIEKSLVRYRRHERNVSAGAQLSSMSDLASFHMAEKLRYRMLERLDHAYASFARDVQSASDRQLISVSQGRRMIGVINYTRRSFSIRRRLIGSHGLKAANLVLRLLLCRTPPREVLRNVPRILPSHFYERYRVAQNASHSPF